MRAGDEPAAIAPEPVTIFINMGGMTSGKIGRKHERVVIVWKTAILPAAIERPRTLPSASET